MLLLSWLVLCVSASAAPDVPTDADPSASEDAPPSDEAPASDDEAPTADEGPASDDDAPIADEAPAPPEAPPAEPDPEPPGPRLPSMLTTVAPVYPQNALEAGEEARVVLLLSIDKLGEVVEASVPEPVGQGFDDAVLQVVYDWRFTPALDAKGRPVAAQIQYAYQFRVTNAPVVSMEGRAKTAGTRAPLDGATVNLQGPDGEVR
ncbi:MAG: energy transducer TonB, partial [Myxococcota bacterium]